MRILRADDFEKMARSVVNDFLSPQSVPLLDGLVKVSAEEGLNPDQIQNLVQLANRIAHLVLFDQKGSEDKTIEFDPADPDDVLKKVFSDRSPPLTDDSEVCEAVSPSDKITDMFGDFPDMSSKIKQVMDEAPDVGESEEVSEPSKHRRATVVIKIRKVAEELETQKHQKALEYKDELDKLASEFAKLYGPDFREFEKEAMALRGELAVPVLTDVRRCLRLSEKIPKYIEKTASVIDTNKSDIKSLDKLIKLAQEHRDCIEAFEYIKEKAGKLL